MRQPILLREFQLSFHRRGTRNGRCGVQPSNSFSTTLLLLVASHVEPHPDQRLAGDRDALRRPSSAHGHRARWKKPWRSARQDQVPLACSSSPEGDPSAWALLPLQVVHQVARRNAAFLRSRSACCWRMCSSSQRRRRSLIASSFFALFSRAFWRTVAVSHDLPALTNL